MAAKVCVATHLGERLLVGKALTPPPSNRRFMMNLWRTGVTCGHAELFIVADLVEALAELGYPTSEFCYSQPAVNRSITCLHLLFFAAGLKPALHERCKEVASMLDRLFQNELKGSGAGGKRPSLIRLFDDLKNGETAVSSTAPPHLLIRLRSPSPQAAAAG